jgi:hypothetical protein
MLKGEREEEDEEDGDQQPRAKALKIEQPLVFYSHLCCLGRRGRSACYRYRRSLLISKIRKDRHPDINMTHFAILQHVDESLFVYALELELSCLGGKLSVLIIFAVG